MTLTRQMSCSLLPYIYRCTNEVYLVTITCTIMKTPVATRFKADMVVRRSVRLWVRIRVVTWICVVSSDDRGYGNM